MKMELIEGSETSAISIVTPGNYPKENVLHTGHGESLKSRNMNKYTHYHTHNFTCMFLYTLRAIKIKLMIIREVNYKMKFTIFVAIFYAMIFSPMAQQPPIGPGPPHYPGFTVTLRHTTLGRTPLDG